MNKQLIVFAFIAIAITYLLAVPVPVMDADASQYAAMSREMKESGSYLQVFEQGKDYLDKPPFIFWISSLFMYLLGENNWGYKIPSVLFTVLAIIATYKFTKRFYNNTIAVLAAFILATCQAIFLITNDIRTDTILMSWVIIAIWQLAVWMQTNKLINFILGATAIGFGMITKGPIALLVPIFSFGAHFISTKKFNYLFKPVYLLGIVIIGIVLLPMCIGLYLQFDKHPEKIVNGLQNVSGLKFYFWTQSFGRITGENVWNNNAPFSFLFENLLWGMLPWTFFFLHGLVTEIIAIIKRKFFITNNEEFITTGGFIITYCSLAISKYQLPHYIYVVLPFIAIITAKSVYQIVWQNTLPILKNIFIALQTIVLAALITATFLILIYTFPTTQIWPWLIPILTILLLTFIIFYKKIKHKIVVTAIAGIVGINIFLSSYFYPNLLQYQLGNVIGNFNSQHQLPKGSIVLYNIEGIGESVHFYTKQIIKSISQVQEAEKNKYVVTSDEGLANFKQAHIGFTIVQQGYHFHVAELNATFLNEATRETACSKYYIIKII